VNKRDQERLARWWWGLDERERVAIRGQFMKKLKTDKEFAREVKRVLEREEG
jgi:hypothetical protein